MKTDGPINLIAILGKDDLESRELRRTIGEGAYRTLIYTDLEVLEARMHTEPHLAAILDIDAVPLGNRAIRRLTLAFPSVCFFCTSRYRFHPDLKDAICYHLFACLTKPVDHDELHYFLRCIADEQGDSRAPPDS